MKRLLIALLVLGLMAVTAPAIAAVGFTIEGQSKRGEATTLNFVGPDAMTFNGSKLNIPVVDEDLYAAGIADGGATSMASSDLAVPIGYSYIRKAIEQTDTAFIAGTMADGKPGQLLTLHITEQPGSQVFTVTPATSTGFASIGFDAVGEIATFWFVDDTTGWVLFGSTNATINLP